MVGRMLALFLAGALSAAGAVAAPAPGGPQRAEALVLRVLRGPTAAFSGEQRSEVAVPGGVARTRVRVSGNGAGWVRREYLSGPAAGLVTVTHGRTVWERTPEGAWTVLRGPGEQDARQAASAVCSNYQVVVGPATKVAGRSGLSVQIKRKQPYNPSRSLLLDPATGIVLRDVTYAPDGTRRSLSEFTSLRIGPQPPGSFKPPERANEPALYGPDSLTPRASAAEVERDTGLKVALPTHVPRGYRVALYGVVQAANGRLMPAVRYSDGLAAFTIFRRGAQARPGPRGAGGRGRGRGWMGGRRAAPAPAGAPPKSTVQASVAVAEGAAASYVLIGDIAENELARVAESLP